MPPTVDGNNGQQLADALMEQLVQTLRERESQTIRAVIPAVQDLPICPRCRIVTAGWMATLAEALEDDQHVDLLAGRLDDLMADLERDTESERKQG